MTSVVAMTNEEGDGETGGRNPFDGPRIEVPEEELRKASLPQVWLGRVKHRLDEMATRVTYGR